VAVNYFKISDFNISGQPIPEDVADKILLYHILPLNQVRKAMGFAIWPSQKSGYRPLWWEKKQGRNGNSQHVFRGKGAVDITCSDFEAHKWTLVKALADHTEYTRISLYSTFIHCDYAGLDRVVYSENWTEKWPLEEIETRIT